MKWWEGKKTWPFISSHAAHAKLDGANGKIRRRWRQIRRIWMDFDAFLRRNGTLMHIQRDLWPHTLTQHWPLTSCILRPTHYIFMIMQTRPHPSLLFITLMNIHDDSATSLLRDVTSLVLLFVFGFCHYYRNILPPKFTLNSGLLFGLLHNTEEMLANEGVYYISRNWPENTAWNARSYSSLIVHSWSW